MTDTTTGTLNAREEFIAQRGWVLAHTDDDLAEIVAVGLERYAAGQHDWFDDIVDGAAVLWFETYYQEWGREPDASELAGFQSDMAQALERTAVPTDPPEQIQVERVTRWSSTYAVNAATATGSDGLEWVTRRDSEVRSMHQPLDGVLRGADGTWLVGGYALHFPGEPVGPPEAWINCRCLARRVQEGEMATISAAADPETQVDPQSAPVDVRVWHGVLAPVGQLSGDRRKFASPLRARALPLPLRWQKADAQGHDGSVIVGSIDEIEFDEASGLIKAAGRFASSVEADEAVGLVEAGMLRGVSVDLDDVTVEFQNEDGSAFDLSAGLAPGDPGPIEVVTEGRVCSASLVAIPAFEEAYVALGSWGAGVVAAGCVPCQERAEAVEWVGAAGVSHAPWDGSAARFTDEEWQRSCVLDRGEEYTTAKTRFALPIKEPSGALSRAGVHAAAARVNQVDAPAAQVAKAKRRLLAAYRELGDEPPEVLTSGAVMVAAAFSVVASGGYPTPPASWFTDPGLERATALTVLDTGRVFGHLCSWDVCHVGLGLSVGAGSECVTPPVSASGYAYFRVGEVVTDDGARVPVGHITMSTGHAGGRMGAAAAAAHYDNTGAVVADVAAGEDAHGIWVAGWVRPGTSAEQVAALRGATLSGDWRRIRGELELVAALAVNVPGFPIPRLAVAASGGGVDTLVASGVLTPVVESPAAAGRVVDEGAIDRFGEQLAAAVVRGLHRVSEREEKVSAARARLRAVRAQVARRELGR